MENKYLTEDLNHFYTEAFNHIKNCPDTFWKLNTELLPYLELINQNPYIKTLFSKGFNQHNTPISFIEFAYTKPIEQHIEKELIPQLTKLFNNTNGNVLSITKKAPIEHKFKAKNEQLKYIFSKNYLNLWHYHIELNSLQKTEHDKFWSVISNLLSDVKP